MYFCGEVIKLSTLTVIQKYVVLTLSIFNLLVGRSQACSQTGSSSRSKRYTYERAGATTKRGSVNHQELLQTFTKILNAFYFCTGIRSCLLGYSAVC